MSGRRIKTALAAALMVLTVSLADARKNSLGTFYGYQGIGVHYERDADDGNFACVTLCAETSELFSGRTALPGMSASFTWNFVLTASERNGHKTVIFAGPGIAAGMCNDFKSSPGFFFGLKGRAGVRMQYSRNVNISISISPVIGGHVTLAEDTVEMKYFKNGLMRAFMPEIGIGYRF